MMRQIYCDFFKVIHSRNLLLLIISIIVTTALLAFAPSYGQMFMVAGENPEKIGEAIGFIVNYIDLGNLPGSVIRTSLSYTIFWIPITILFSALLFSSDFTIHSVILSRAKGIAPEKILLSKLFTLFITFSLFYWLHCICSLIIKCFQFNVSLSFEHLLLFFSTVFTNSVLLCVIVIECAFLFLLFKSLLSCVCLMLVYHAGILLVYPTIYMKFETTPLIGKILIQTSPIYYIMNTSALCFKSITLCYAFLIAIVMIVCFLAGALILVKSREELMQ